MYRTLTITHAILERNSFEDIERQILKLKMSLAGRTTMAVRRLTTSAIRQDLGHVPPPGHVRISVLVYASDMLQY